MDPISRGYFYSSDDLAAFDVSDQVEAGTLAMPATPSYVTNGTSDTGDDMVLNGRPTPMPRSEPVGRGGTEPLVLLPAERIFLPSEGKSPVGMNGFREPGTSGIEEASLDPAGATSRHIANASADEFARLADSTGAADSSIERGLNAGSELSNAIGSSLSGLISRQTITDGGGGSNPNNPGGSSPRAGEAFPWEGWGPGGGSTAATGYVNTQTGNRLTAMPIVGWKVPGGMSLGLTMFTTARTIWTSAGA